MKVLYVSHSVDCYGATIALLNIIREMVGRGVEVGVMCPSDKGWLIDELTKIDDVKVYPMIGYPSMLLFPGARMNVVQRIKYHVGRVVKITVFQWKTFKLMRDVYPDIVHCNSAVNDYALLGCRLLHIPHVWHAREYIDKYFGCKVFPSMNILRWKMRLKFNHTIAITNGVFKHYNLCSEKDTVIYDGIFDENVKPVDLFVKRLDYKYFLFVGAMGEGKGAHCAVEQFCKIANNYQNIHLILACGYSEDDYYYKKCLMIGREYAERIHFVGFRKDVYQLMADAVAVVVPSMFEGFGFTVAEAMFNGTLVIGRNAAGIKEQFDIGLEQTGEEIGLRFDKDEEVPVLMERALVGDFTEMKQRAKRVVLNNYTTQKNADEIYALYKRLI